MKFEQLVKYNMKNIFLQKSYTKCGEETIFPDPFLKTKIEYISASIVQTCIQFLFNIYQLEGYQKILELSCRPLAFSSHKAFSKNKGVLSPCLIFCMIFKEKYFLLYFMNWPNFIVWFLRELLRNMYSCLLTTVIHRIFGTNSSFHAG